MEEIISINNLTFLNVFSNFTISFSKNQLISVSGPNNCGKTTLIRILARQILFKGMKFNHQNSMAIPLDEYFKNIKVLIPMEFTFTYETLEEEVLSYLTNSNKEAYTYLCKQLKLNSIKNKAFKTLALKDQIKAQLTIYLLANPQVLLLDDIGLYFSKTEFDIMNCLNYFKQTNNMTIIMTTSDLTQTLKTDYLYILYNSTIVLEGPPLEVLKKDNVINKIGLRLPFMMDLSVKLCDYNLLEEPELDMNRMVDKLWK